MNIIKVKRKQKNFTIIDNAIFDDMRLNFTDKGLLAQMLSKPDDWKISTKQIAKAGRVGIDAIRASFNRLIECGYMIRTKKKDINGHFYTEYFIYEMPLHKREPKEKLGRIYQIKCVPSNTVYIGQTIQKGDRRFSNHWSNLNKDQHVNKSLQNDWNQYGSEAFVAGILETRVPESLLLDRETYHIMKRKGPIYNVLPEPLQSDLVGTATY